MTPPCSRSNVRHLFFEPDDPESSARKLSRETKAKGVCATCDRTAACLAEHSHEEFGVFGGTTPAERRATGLVVRVDMRRREIQHGTAAGYKRCNKANADGACTPCKAAHAREVAGRKAIHGRLDHIRARAKREAMQMMRDRRAVVFAESMQMRLEAQAEASATALTLVRRAS